MDQQLKQGLERCETDLSGALDRFMGDEMLYLTCLSAFLRDPTVDALESALEDQRWDDAFTASHALKGMAGNMGFVPLYHASAKLVMQLRSGRISELKDSFQAICCCYRQIAGVILENRIREDTT